MALELLGMVKLKLCAQSMIERTWAWNEEKEKIRDAFIYVYDTEALKCYIIHPQGLTVVDWLSRETGAFRVPVQYELTSPDRPLGDFSYQLDFVSALKKPIVIRPRYV